MIKQEKKDRIKALSTEEMIYEIERGRKSRFQREAFDYLKTCYQQRISKTKSEQQIQQAKNLAPNQTSSEPQKIHNPRETTLKTIATGVIIFVLGVMAVWILNHYFGTSL